MLTNKTIFSIKISPLAVWRRSRFLHPIEFNNTIVPLYLGSKLLDVALADDNRFKNKGKVATYPQIEEVMLAVLGEAEKNYQQCLPPEHGPKHFKTTRH